MSLSATMKDMADEIDLRDKLIFAAGSLAADFGGALSADRAEELVFTSADRLLAAASVTDFVPILAERDARRTIRTGRAGPVTVSLPAVRCDPVTVEAPVEAIPVETVAVESPTLETTTVAEPPVAASPLLALPDGQLTELRGGVERARERLAEWQTDLTRR
jgi:hypothetical protein